MDLNAVRCAFALCFQAHTHKKIWRGLIFNPLVGQTEKCSTLIYRDLASNLPVHLAEILRPSQLNERIASITQHPKTHPTLSLSQNLIFSALVFYARGSSLFRFHQEMAINKTYIHTLTREIEGAEGCAKITHQYTSLCWRKKVDLRPWRHAKISAAQLPFRSME